MKVLSDGRSWTEIDWAAHKRRAWVRGLHVDYVDYGEGPPLLLIHGMGGSWESWLANIPALGEHYRVIAVDLPGFGGSQPLQPDSEFLGYVDVLEALLDELMIPSAVVFGHSLGGLVSLALAACSPQRVRGVVLVSGGGAALSRVRLAMIQAVFLVFRFFLSLPGARGLLRRPRIARALVSPAVHAPRTVQSDLLGAMLPEAVTAGFLDAIRLGGNGLRSLDPDAVTAPVLLVWGREDRILPLATGQQLTSRLRLARLTVLDNVGHCAMFEAPEQFHRAAEEFLAEQWSDRGVPPTDRATAWSWTAASVLESDDGEGRCGDGHAG